MNAVLKKKNKSRFGSVGLCSVVQIYAALHCTVLHCSCTALQLRDHVAFLLSLYIWLPQLWRANCGRLKKPNSSIVEETWGHLLYSFMGLKQDKCETHISSHMSLLLSDLQRWRTAALQQPPPPPRAVVCHKSLSPWLITQALHHGTPLSSLRMMDGGTLAEQTRAKPRELWRTQGCRKWSVAHAEDIHCMPYWLGLDVAGFDPLKWWLETPLGLVGWVGWSVLWIINAI